MSGHEPRGENKRRAGNMSLFSLTGFRAPEIEPSLGPRADSEVEDGELVGGSPHQVQSIYLAASGALIQFNAIVAAIQGTLITINAEPTLRAASATALGLHVVAAFMLCWAARPITERPNTVRGLTYPPDHFRHVDDTFRNYRRGWRATICALLASSLAAGVFVASVFGITVQDLAGARKHAVQGFNYLEEHGQGIRSDIVNMAKDLDDAAPTVRGDEKKLRELVFMQAGLRNLPVAYVVSGTGRIKVTAVEDAKIPYVAPPEHLLRAAEAGQVPLFMPLETARVAAIVQLRNYPDSYLYVARGGDPEGVKYEHRK
jgi:hypothetical protein